MAEPITFKGCNLKLLAPKESVNVEPMECFANGKQTVECWKLSKEELEEINKTGVIWVVLYTNLIPPVYIGTEDDVRYMIADNGVWKRD